VDDIAPFRKDIENAAVLLLQLETPMATVVEAAKWAHAKGVPVILNPAPAAKLPKALYGCLDWITPNETEAELLTGIKVTDAASAGRAADAFRRRGVKHVAITMGARGVYCGSCGRIYPAKRVKAVDCVAAGDTFNGAFAVALAEGMSCKDAIAFAQKASAISVTRPGAQASVPYRHEVVSER
jgi:ribokinase